MKTRHNLNQVSADKARVVRNKARNLVDKALEQTQQSLKKGLASAQDTLQERAKDEQRKLEHMQKAAHKRLASGWSTAQESLESGWKATQNMAEEGSKRVQKRAAQVAASTKDTAQKLRRRYKRQRNNRSRGRRLFRWGLVIGIILALVFAPISGIEARKRIALLWDHYKQYFTQK